jgi:hypothetical protein
MVLGFHGHRRGPAGGDSAGDVAASAPVACRLALVGVDGRVHFSLLSSWTSELRDLFFKDPELRDLFFERPRAQRSSI